MTFENTSFSVETPKTESFENVRTATSELASKNKARELSELKADFYSVEFSK